MSSIYNQTVNNTAHSINDTVDNSSSLDVGDDNLSHSDAGDSGS